MKSVFNLSKRCLPIIVISILGIAVYSNTFNSSFQLDDKGSIVENFKIRNLGNLKSIWAFWPTRFITYLSFAFNYRFNKLDVFGYHLFNLIIHLPSAILVWWLSLLTFSTPYMRGKKKTAGADSFALFTGLIFVSHPIQTEGVTYIVQRAASMATLFYLASLCLFVKSRLSQQEKSSSQASRPYFYGSLISAVAAMFAKEMAITLPFMVLLYEYCFLCGNKRIDWKRAAPFLITLTIIPVTMAMTGSVNFEEMRRTSEPGPGISGWHYLLTQFRVMITYIKLLFVPINQNLDYDFPVSKTLIEPATLLSLCVLMLILVVAILLFKRYRLISFSIFWFYLTLLPESSVIPIRDLIFEHRLYLPMAGYAFFSVSMIYYFLGKNKVKFAAIILIMLACYSVLAYKRNLAWKDEISLWSDAISKSPNAATPYNNRANAYVKKGDYDGAISDCEKALSIDPDMHQTYSIRGEAYIKKGNYARAIADCNQAVKINPNFVNGYIMRGIAYYMKDDYDAAIADYAKAIEIDPDLSAAAYNNRAIAYDKKGEYDKALMDYTKMIETYKDYAAYVDRASTYFYRQEYDKAWKDVYAAQALGYKISPEFLNLLREASGR